MRATRAIIDTSALIHNVGIIKKLAPHSKIIAIVKANAYGHGLQPVTKILSPEVDALGVACCEEACLLRESGIKNRILLLEGLFEAEELELIQKHQLEIVIHSQYQIDFIKEFPQKLSLKVWLKADTGMHRLGFNEDDFIKAHQQLQNIPQKIKTMGLMTHFANADTIQSPHIREQIKVFKKLTVSFSEKKTLANSAAILAFPETHQDQVRPGLLLYGCSPFMTHTGKQHDLKPVMTLESKLISIMNLKKGESVGYGSTWKTNKDTQIGTIAIGYGDGYPRHAKSGTPVWLNGREVPLVGTVSMDMITVDLGVNASDKIGDRVVLWGKELPVEIVAESANTISYDLLCGISARVDFQYQ